MRRHHLLVLACLLAGTATAQTQAGSAAGASAPRPQARWRASDGRLQPAVSILFDFDSAPLLAPLPLDLTAGGITAHLSATGQGYSIQHADALGFTPAGFAGYCVYPSSVFLADLLIGFSMPITDLSILYAPEEYACDSSAQMRITAFSGGNPVATATTTAPNPGTWPTGTLAISHGAGFDAVVIHYDAAPPTGGDWGPIFMADNMTVTPLAIAVGLQSFEAE